MKAIYVGDCMTDTREEARTIQSALLEKGIKTKVRVVEYLQAALEGTFDVLFFDWGGMSVGNSLLERNCEYILDDAHEHPSRDYVMTSLFTKLAMDDAVATAERNHLGKPANLFLTLDEYCEQRHEC